MERGEVAAGDSPGRFGPASNGEDAGPQGFRLVFEL
jgi:hypothetical protein